MRNDLCSIYKINKEFKSLFWKFQSFISKTQKYVKKNSKTYVAQKYFEFELKMNLQKKIKEKEKGKRVSLFGQTGRPTPFVTRAHPPLP